MTQADAGTATERIVVPTARMPGSSRGRWLIALAVAAVAIGLTIVALLVLGGRQTPEALRYVPADAVVVAELRLDLPGDQLQHVGNLLAHFPGFADQSTLAQKLDEAGDRLLGGLTDGQVSYTGDLKPWVSGPAFAAYRGAVIEANERVGTILSGLLVATTNGAAGCETLFEGHATRSEAHRGLELQVLTEGIGACVVDGRYVLVGDRDSVRAGLDARAEGRGVDTTERYRAARDALGGEQLATLFVSSEAIERLADLSDQIPGSRALPSAPDLPAWSITGIRAEDDALVVDSVSAPLPVPSAAPSLLSLPPAHPSELTARVPGDAILYAETQGAGVAILNVLSMLRADPQLSPVIAELDQVVTAFGGAEKLLGWVDDAALVVRAGVGDPELSISGGVLLLAPDAATASARVESYRSLLALAALGGAVELETSTIGAVEVTTVTVGDVAGRPTDEPIAMSFAARDNLVVLGTDSTFVQQILFGGGRSLAEVPEYQAAVARGHSPSRSTVYISIDEAVSLAVANLPADAVGRFDTEIRPYVTPFDAGLLTVVETDGAFRARVVVTVSDTPITP